MIAHQSCHIVAHSASHFHIIGTYKCGVVTIRFTVEENYRNPFLHCFVDNRRNGIGLIGRDDEQIDTLTDELLYLLNLPFIVIIGRSKLYCDAIFHVGGRLELLV